MEDTCRRLLLWILAGVCDCAGGRLGRLCVHVIRTRAVEWFVIGELCRAEMGLFWNYIGSRRAWLFMIMVS